MGRPAGRRVSDSRFSMARLRRGNEGAMVSPLLRAAPETHRLRSRCMNFSERLSGVAYLSPGVLAAKPSIFADWASLVPGDLRFSIEQQFECGACAVFARARHNLGDRGHMNMTRPMYAYACLMRPSWECLWRPRAHGVASSACLCVTVPQGQNVVC
jgi:hypothetical protein